MHLVYCDLLMNEIREKCREGVFFSPGKVEFDLHKEGYMLSTKKTMEVIDSNGTKYKVTVEQT